MPYVAESPADLIAHLSGIAHLADGRLVVDDEARFRAEASATSPGRPRSRATTRRSRPPAGSSGRRARRSARGRRASRSCTWPAAAARSPGSPSRRSTSAPRRSTWRATFYETAARADVGAVIFELARSEQTYTFQRPMDYATVDPRGRDRGGLARPRVHPGRPLPVQRQEVRHRPRGDDRGDPPGLPARDRRRLPQHRHRQLDPRRPVQAGPGRGAARELPPRGGAHGAHPEPRDRRRDGQRRRRDRRGRQAELDAPTSSRRTSTGTTASWRAWPRTRPASPRSASRPAPRTAACRCPTAASPRSSSTSRSCATSARSPARTAWPARSSTARPRCPRSCSTSFPAVETAEIHLATGFQNTLYEHPAFPASLMDEIYAWCRANAADERKDGQTEEQFLYTTRKKAIGPFKRQLWELETKDEILAAQGDQAGLPVHGAAGQRVDGAGGAVREAGRRRTPHPRGARRRGPGLTGAR